MARCGLIWMFFGVIVVILLINFFQPSPPGNYNQSLRYHILYTCFSAVYKFNCLPNKKLVNPHLFDERKSTGNVSDPVIDQNNYALDRCEVIHIGIVCTGEKNILQFFTMVKSLYFYRSNPLHFHIMANKFSEKTLSTLFETWDVPQGKLLYLSYHIVITRNYIFSKRYVLQCK